MDAVITKIIFLLKRRQLVTVALFKKKLGLVFAKRKFKIFRTIIVLIAHF